MIMRFKEEEKPLTASMHLRAHCSLLIIQQEIQQTNKWNNSAQEVGRVSIPKRVNAAFAMGAMDSEVGQCIDPLKS